MHTNSKPTRSRFFLVKRSLALALALAMISPPASGLLVAARAQGTPPAAPPSANTSPSGDIRIPTVPVQPGPIKTILLFPFANAIPAGKTSGGFNADIVGARVEDAVKMRLNVIGRYKADSFSPALPQIQRALEESRVEGLTESDLTPPYDDPQKGEKIASQIGTDGYLLGGIEALSIDPTTRNVALTVSATLYHSETGGTAKSLAYTGHGISYNATDNPDNLLQSAINDVAGHIVSALNADAAPEKHRMPVVDYARGGHSNNSSILLGLLVAVGIGLAISSSHHSSNNNSAATPTGTTTGTGTGIPNPPVLTGGGSSGPPSPPNPG